MFFDSNALLHVFVGGTAFELNRTESRFASSYLGGPPDLQELTREDGGDTPLHHIATLSCDEFDCSYRGRLPLLHGMTYQGSLLEYEVAESGHVVRTTYLSPNESDPEWPYPGYPALLPYLQLEVWKKRICTWEEFANEFINAPNEPPADLTVMMPPPMHIGFSLWGRHGDTYPVQLCFGLNFTTMKVEVTSWC
ncbi:hypothetical protein Pla123a_44810 [Posidoniimonas polymericola]|uniref:Uncharacterized protein n=1 Tax=Posidoniimonas polymericola TaxID=2528002 RepID=A0A5C5XWT1_9BACT|nr:hypothetical protein [Posidoniimonas polymericola]TWT66783.1 hypothetical protein Pla123a_44810 [Posidoniimonas polymericola]